MYQRQQRNSGNTKLTDEIVRIIRKRYAEGATQRQLCEVYDMSITTIGRIVRNETWRWVTGDAPHVPPSQAQMDALMARPITPEEQAAAEASLARFKELMAKQGSKE